MLFCIHGPYRNLRHGTCNDNLWNHGPRGSIRTLSRATEVRLCNNFVCSVITFDRAVTFLLLFKCSCCCLETERRIVTIELNLDVLRILLIVPARK